MLTASQIDIQAYDPANPGQVGVILGESNEEYHANDAISNSQLFDFHEERRTRHGGTTNYYNRYVAKTHPRKSAAHFVIGSALHTLALEGLESYIETYDILDEEDTLNFRGKDATWASVLALNRRLREPLNIVQLEEISRWKADAIRAEFAKYPVLKETLTQEQDALVNTMYKSVLANPEAADLLAEREGAYSELVFRSDDQVAVGIPLQCRLDRVILGPSFPSSMHEPGGIDIKTIDSLENFEKHFYQYGYYRSWPYYAAVTRAVLDEEAFFSFKFIVVEKQEPYDCMVFEPTPMSRDWGRKEINEDLQALKQCMETNHWPKPGEQRKDDEGRVSINYVGLPSWWGTNER